MAENMGMGLAEDTFVIAFMDKANAEFARYEVDRSIIQRLIDHLIMLRDFKKETATH